MLVSSRSCFLTILLDDYQTSLPLNPTKQDTAFADCSTGEIFRANLYAWIRAAVRVYYGRYFDCLYHKKKTPLMEALWALAPTIRTFDPETLTKSKAESHYGSLGNSAASLMGDTIRLANNASKMFTPGTTLGLITTEKGHSPSAGCIVSQPPRDNGLDRRHDHDETCTSWRCKRGAAAIVGVLILFVKLAFIFGVIRSRSSPCLAAELC
jgi:hypothetical protein